MTPEELTHHQRLWKRAFGQPVLTNPRQLYRVAAVLASEGGIVSEPTCGRCDGVFAEELPDRRTFDTVEEYQQAWEAAEARRSQQLTPIRCPGCSLIVCHVCWPRHVGSDDRCTPDRIASIQTESRRRVQELHTFDAKVLGKAPCRCVSCADR